MGPKKAAEMFKGLCPGASSFVVTLYGSLAATGKGHLTDVALKEALTGGTDTGIEIVWKPKEFLPQHPNGMNFKAYNAQGEMLCEKTYFSVGGGDISETGRRDAHKDVYPFSKMKDILGWCNENNSYFWEYVAKYEDPDIWDYLAERWEVMKDSIVRGLDHEGVLPGGLNVRRKAYAYYQHAKSYNSSMQRRGLLFAYALAVSEENASGGTIVTAPTQDSQCDGDGRTGRGPHQGECLDIGCGSGLSGRGRHGLRHGLCGSDEDSRRDSSPDRVRGLDGYGALPRTDLRSGLRIGADTLYRAQCDSSCKGYGCGAVRIDVRRKSHSAV